MTTYRVRWEIDIDAESALEAAKKALSIQRDTDADNTANCFEVAEWISANGQIGDFEMIDLMEAGPLEVAAADALALLVNGEVGSEQTTAEVVTRLRRALGKE